MADYEFVTSTGTILPDTSTTLEQVRAEYRAAFGDDLDVSAETPQGVLITAETEARDAVARNNAELANQINPNLAGGVFLDALWALTAGARVSATPSLLEAVIVSGVPGTPIPAGSIASVGSGGAQFETISAVTLGSGGSAAVNFQSVEDGPIECGTGELNVIVSSVLGWETVSNPAPAVLGQATESDAASRLRRRQTLALQGVALPEAIISGLYSQADIRSMSFRENYTSSPVTIEGVTLSPHSIYACVDGGTDDDVALMLLRKKSLGCAWNGSTDVTVTDPYSGQEYTVSFDRPDLVTVYVRVTVSGGAGVPNVTTAVRAAIVSYGNGDQDGEEGFVVGGDVSPFEIAGAVNRDYPSIFVSNVQLSTDGSTYSTATVSIAINEKASVLSGNIEVITT